MGYCLQGLMTIDDAAYDFTITTTVLAVLRILNSYNNNKPNNDYIKWNTQYACKDYTITITILAMRRILNS